MPKIELTILFFVAMVGLWSGGLVLNLLREVAASFPA